MSNFQFLVELDLCRRHVNSVFHIFVDYSNLLDENFDRQDKSKTFSDTFLVTHPPIIAHALMSSNKCLKKL